MQDFSYEQYAHILKAFKSAGYAVTGFEDYDAAKSRTVILRHDVDYTLDGVEDMARIEREADCTATYFFRVHADEYNVFAPSTHIVLQRIKAMGHSIGLHFEAMNIGRALRIDPTELLQRERDVLEAALGYKIQSCSEHRELSGTIHKTPLYEEEHNPCELGFEYYAMDQKYSKDMKYLSDSNANWREGNPLNFINKFDRFQILVHADWWFNHDLLLKGPYYHPTGTHI